jgi:hypothetical protein
MSWDRRSSCLEQRLGRSAAAFRVQARTDDPLMAVSGAAMSLTPRQVEALSADALAARTTDEETASCDSANV